ncbi:MAG: DMT family transporter [Campylobacteraceae bacterium]|nr:DMT family transporter [Campylobacteraceae bacterium]
MNKNLFYVLILLSMILWGASWINTKVLTLYVNQYEIVFLRVFFSGIFMLPLLLFLKVNFRIDFKTIILVLLASAVMIFYSISLFFGVSYGTAGLGGALVTTLIPINTFVILALLHRKTISLKHSFALILGAFGVLTMLDIWYFDLGQVFSKHNIYFLIASILWPILTIITARASNTTPLIFNFYIYVCCSFISAFAIDFEHISRVANYDYIFWINILCLTALSSAFATTTYFIGSEKLGVNKVSSFVFLVPSSALVLSAIFLDEKIDFNTLLGTVCAVVAIYILNDIKIRRLFIQ